MNLEKDKKSPKEIFARSVCLFLAEMLRTRNVNLRRAAEIADGVIKEIDQINDEKDFLKIINGLEYDFQELNHLRRDLVFYYEVSKRQKLETYVRDFAALEMSRKPEKVVQLMEEALIPTKTLIDLGQKFPEFKEFVEKQKDIKYE